MDFKMSLEQRHLMVVGAFKFAYFGQVPMENAIWSELQQFCETFFAARDANEKSTHRLLSELYQVTLTDPLTRFPISNSHKKSVIEWIRENFEKNSTGPPPVELIHDFDELKLIEHSEPEFVYKSYDRGESLYVTLLEENREIIGHGTTGLTSWQGALYLSDWAKNNHSKLKGKRILELGAGVGMLGISMLKTIEILDYQITDCHYKVLNFLAHNLKINFPTNTNEDVTTQEMEEFMIHGPPTIFLENEESKETYKQQVSLGDGHTCDVTLKQLDWMKFNDESFKKVDIILGSDIVYERTLLPALSSVIKTVLVRSDSDDPVAYIACTERSQTTLAYFEKAMEDEGLSFQVIQRGMYSPTDHILCSDVLHQMTKIYQVELSTQRHQKV